MALDAKVTSLAEQGRASEIETILVEAKHAGMIITEDLNTGLFAAYIQGQNTDRALDVMLRMAKAGQNVELALIRALVTQFTVIGRGGDAQAAVEHLKEYGILPKRSTVTKILSYVPSTKATTPEAAAEAEMLSKIAADALRRTDMAMEGGTDAAGERVYPLEGDEDTEAATLRRRSGRGRGRTMPSTLPSRDGRR